MEEFKIYLGIVIRTVPALPFQKRIWIKAIHSATELFDAIFSFTLWFLFMITFPISTLIVAWLALIRDRRAEEQQQEWFAEMAGQLFTDRDE